MFRVITVVAILMLTGCANTQQAAQSHWDWINTVGKTSEQLAQPRYTDHYTTGVNITPITVNGRSFTVVTPAR